MRESELLSAVIELIWPVTVSTDLPEEPLFWKIWTLYHRAEMDEEGP